MDFKPDLSAKLAVALSILTISLLILNICLAGFRKTNLTNLILNNASKRLGRFSPREFFGRMVKKEEEDFK